MGAVDDLTSGAGASWVPVLPPKLPRTRPAKWDTEVQLLRLTKGRAVLPGLASKLGWEAGGTLVYSMSPNERLVRVFSVNAKQLPLSRTSEPTSRLDAAFRTTIPVSVRNWLAVPDDGAVLAFVRPRANQRGAQGAVLTSPFPDPLTPQEWEELSWPPRDAVRS